MPGQQDKKNTERRPDHSESEQECRPVLRNHFQVSPAWSCFLCFLCCLVPRCLGNSFVPDETRMTYDPPRVGVPVTLLLTFRTGKRLSSPNTIEIQLDKDMRRTGSTVSLDSSHASISRSATWNEQTQIISMGLTASIEEQQLVTVRIDASQGFILPDSGLLQDDPDLGIRYLEGNNAGFSQIYGPAVGSFVDTKIEYLVSGSDGALLRTGTPVFLKITFTPKMKIRNRERVILTLARFTGTESSSLVFSSLVDSTPTWSASWNPTTQRLILQYTGGVDLFDTPVSLTLNPHISIASDGVRPNDPSLLIESDAASGPVLPTAIAKSPGVDGVILNSAIHFTRSSCVFNGFNWLCTNLLAMAGEPCEVQVSLTIALPLGAGEHVRVNLPGFTGASLSPIPVRDSPIIYGTGTTRSFTQHPYGCKSNEGCKKVDEYTSRGALGYASWISETHTLDIVASVTVDAFTNITMVVPLVGGIRLPTQGLRGARNDAAVASNGDLTISTIGNKPVPRSPFRSVTPVGMFSHFRVLFSQKLAGEATGVTMQFKTVMNLEPGDTIILALPYFRGKSQTIELTSKPLSLFRSASWQPESLTLQAWASIGADTDVEVLIPQSFGITTPLQGMPANFSGITVSTTAQQGPVPPTSVTYSDKIPAILTGTSLVYDRSDGLQPTNINVSFTAGRVLSARTFVEINLPLFSGNDASAIPVSAFVKSASTRRTLNPVNYIESASWTQASSLLRLAIKEDVPAQDSVLVVVPATSGLTLPADGLAPDSGSLTIRYFSGTAESAPATRVESSPVIVQLLAGTKLEFGAGAGAGLITAANLTVTPAFPQGFGIGDILTLSLPGFRLNTTRATIPVISVPPGKVLDTASWSESNGVAKISMTIAEAVTTATMFSATQDGGLIVPRIGVQKDLPNIKFSAKLLGMGTISETSLLSVQPVGALYSSPQFIFNPPQASTAAEITVKMTAYMPLGPGDIISFKLDGFTGVTNTEPIAVESLPDRTYIPKASWSLETRTLAMTVGSPIPIPPGTPLTITIPSSSTVAVPVDGIPLPPSCASSLHTDCPLMFQVSSPYGLVVPTPVYDYAPIGVFSTSILTCTPRVASERTQITVNFTYVRPISPGDTLELVLREFKYPPLVGTTKVLPGSVFDQGDIVTTPAFVAFAFDAVRAAPANKQQILTIPISTGVLIPMFGVSYEAPSMFISMNAAAGKAPVAAVTSSPSIGAFLESQVVVDPLTSGSICEIILTFTPTMPIAVGEHVIITLTGFLGPLVTTTNVTNLQIADNRKQTRIGNTSHFRSGTWSLRSRRFVMVVAEPVLGGIRQYVSIPRSAGLRVPASGMEGYKFASTIETDAAKGKVDPTLIFSKTNVSAVLSKTAFEIVTREAGAPSELHFILQSMLRLDEGSTIRFILPNFFGGKQCWDALLGTPEFNHRCLTALNPSELQSRYCTDVDPTINAFQRRAEGGCYITPGVAVLPNIVLANPEERGTCTCLNSLAVSDAARTAYSFARKSKNGANETLPPGYGMNCSAWDNANCPAIMDSTGPWCCMGWWNLTLACPSHLLPVIRRSWSRASMQITMSVVTRRWQMHPG